MPRHAVVLVDLDPQRLAERRQQAILVHLRQSLDALILDIVRDIAQLSAFPLSS